MCSSSTLFVSTDRFTSVFCTEDLLNNPELPVKIKTLEKGDQLWLQEEKHPYTYHMVEGLVKLYLASEDGLTKTLFYHNAETEFGFQIFKQDMRTATIAEAVTRCKVIAIHQKDLHIYCEAHTSCYVAYIEYILKLLNSLTAEIASISFESGLRRLATLFSSLTKKDKDTILFSVDELANILGMHRNSVSNSLAYLRSKGIISKQQRPIIIDNYAALQMFLNDEHF